MQGTLLLAILRIKSSYSRNVELGLEETDGIPDTLQWWFDNNGCYRIRTYALDHDIHVWDIGHSPKATLELARANNSKHYGDVIAAQYEIHMIDSRDNLTSWAAFEELGLPATIEIDPRGHFVFWKPDEGKYSTKSAPREKS